MFMIPVISCLCKSTLPETSMYIGSDLKINYLINTSVLNIYYVKLSIDLKWSKLRNHSVDWQL